MADWCAATRVPGGRSKRKSNLPMAHACAAHQVILALNIGETTRTAVINERAETLLADAFCAAQHRSGASK